MLIQSVSFLYFGSQNNAVKSIHIPCSVQYQRPTVPSLLAGLLRNGVCCFGEVKHFIFTPKHAEIFWHLTSILLDKCLCIFLG